MEREGDMNDREGEEEHGPREEEEDAHDNAIKCGEGDQKDVSH
jgi:hypothetical protein